MYKVKTYNVNGNTSVVIADVIETSKDGEVLFTGQTHAAKRLAKFWGSGGGFNGWTPSFVARKHTYTFEEDELE